MKKILALSLVLAGSAWAQDMQHGANNGTQQAATRLENCVIQQALPGKNMTGAFFVIERDGSATDLVEVKIPSITPRVEIHTMVMKGDVMEMTLLEDKRIHEGERVFRKGADHIMLMDIPEAQLPKKGEKHVITAHFSDGSMASCRASVKTVEELMKKSVEKEKDIQKKQKEQYKKNQEHSGHY